MTKHYRDLPTTDYGLPHEDGSPRDIDNLFGDIQQEITRIKSEIPAKVIECWMARMAMPGNEDIFDRHPEGDGVEYSTNTVDGEVSIQEFYEDSCVTQGMAITVPGETIDDEQTVDHFYLSSDMTRKNLRVENVALDTEASAYYAGITERGRVYDPNLPEANADRMTRLLHSLRAV